MIRIDDEPKLYRATTNPHPRALWSHVWPDECSARGVRELHAFAALVGLRPSWYQEKSAERGFPHYDVTIKFRRSCIEAGAVPSSLREWFARQRALASPIRLGPKPVRWSRRYLV